MNRTIRASVGHVLPRLLMRFYLGDFTIYWHIKCGHIPRQRQAERKNGWEERGAGVECFWYALQFNRRWLCTTLRRRQGSRIYKISFSDKRLMGTNLVLMKNNVEVLMLGCPLSGYVSSVYEHRPKSDLRNQKSDCRETTDFARFQCHLRT